MQTNCKKCSLTQISQNEFQLHLRRRFSYRIISELNLIYGAVINQHLLNHDKTYSQFYFRLVGIQIISRNIPIYYEIRSNPYICLSYNTNGQWQQNLREWTWYSFPWRRSRPSYPRYLGKLVLYQFVFNIPCGDLQTEIYLCIGLYLIGVLRCKKYFTSIRHGPSEESRSSQGKRRDHRMLLV